MLLFSAVGAFAQTAIKNLRIPYTVENIDQYAFAHCQNLEEVFIENDDLRLIQNVFENCESLNASVAASILLYEINNK